MRKKQTLENALKGSGGLGATSEEVIAAVKIQGEINGNNSTEKHTSSRQTWSETPVTYLSGNRWLVKNVGGLEGDVLSGNYIADKQLVEIIKKDGANRVEVECSVYAQKSDIEVSPEGNMIQKKYRSIKHKEKFMKAIIARAIEENTGRNSGWIPLSRVTLFKAEE